MVRNGLLKLGDFGIARVLNQTSEMAETVVGTPYYLSPEIVQSNKYGFPTDIWSLGVLLYEMCALRPPFNGANLHMLAM
jgi:NIMA (never in mitosis gene a)-related kinase